MTEIEIDVEDELIMEEEELTLSDIEKNGVVWIENIKRPMKKKRRGSTSLSNERRPYECHKCPLAFPTPSKLKVHLRTHTGERPFACNVCHRRYTTLWNMQQHAATTHAEAKPFKCDICDARYGDHKKLNKHKRENHLYSEEPAVVKMQVSADEKEDVLTKKSAKLRKPRGVNTEDWDVVEKPHKCEICRKAFPVLANLKRHMKMRHMPDEEPWGYTSDDVDELIRREYKGQAGTHTKGKVHVCTVCGSGYSQAESLCTHMRTHVGDKLYACAVCGDEFSTFIALSKHTQTHTARKSYTCVVCKMHFALATSLYIHRRAHHAGEVSEVCSVPENGYSMDEFKIEPHEDVMNVSKTFTSLENHSTSAIASHGAVTSANELGERVVVKIEKPRRNRADRSYVCSYCHRCFGDNQTLITHVRTHTNERPYRCKVCGRAFKTTCVYRRHMYTHSANKPYKCTLCDAQFIRSYALDHHMRIRHDQD